MKLITCLIIVLLSVESTLQFRCTKKMFDGRPKEWRTSAGKTIAYYGGYWTLDQCRLLCEATSGCAEFRIKKNSRVSYSGCVLMKAGTTYSGAYRSSFTMYKLAPCCSKKKFDGRPKEWQTRAGKTIASYGGYWTLEQCKALCEEHYNCREFRIKKNSRVSYSGCILMIGGTTSVSYTHLTLPTICSV